MITGAANRLTAEASNRIVRWLFALVLSACAVCSAAVEVLLVPTFTDAPTLQAAFSSNGDLAAEHPLSAAIYRSVVAWIEAAFLHGYFAEAADARKRNHPASTTRQSGRKSAEHAGRRVCPRRDGAHSRREARRAVDEAGHCHRFVESAAVGRQPSAAEKGDGIRPHPKVSPIRFARTRQKAVSAALQGCPQRAQTRGTLGGIAQRPGAAGARVRTPSRAGSTSSRGVEGGAHAQAALALNPRSSCCSVTSPSSARR